jgi:trehalose 6-phosphate phosphatase
MTAALFSPRGREALRRLGTGPALLSFDLDGTLAPLVRRPGDAMVSRITASRLQALALRWPVAVITGRAVVDARRRLGFEPHFLVGNHGAERAGGATYPAPHYALAPCREQARRWADAFDQRGVDVEDKGASLAWHYRRSSDVATVRPWLDSLLAELGLGINATHGHSVLNITPSDAPNKGDALVQLMHECGAPNALIVGDDVNDEPAFARAGARCVSVRIAPVGIPSCAHFRLGAQSQVNALLSYLLSL